MTYTDAWVGLPPHGLSEERSPLLPMGDAIYSAVRDGVKSGRMRGEQVDWGSYAALMTQTEITAFLATIYGPAGEYEASWDARIMGHMVTRMRAARAYIAGLPPDEVFALHVSEF